jgi:hypothetical protein
MLTLAGLELTTHDTNSITILPVRNLNNFVKHVSLPER